MRRRSRRQRHLVSPFLKYLRRSSLCELLLTNFFTVWTSVITLAESHTAALTSIAAGNQRFLVCNGDFDNQELADIIHASTVIPHSAKIRVPIGTPGDRLKGKIYSADSSKVEKTLNIDLKAESLEETVEGLVNQLLELEEQSKAQNS